MTTPLPAPRTSPRVARALIGLLLPRDEQEFVLGDLEEGFTARLAAGADLRAARRWYWRAALSSIAAIGPVPAQWLRGRGLGYDIRFALRSLSRSPTFTVPAVLVLTLGIGATTAVFSVVDAVVFRPLAFEDEGRLLSLSEVSASGAPSGGSVAPQNFFDWRERAGGVFEDLAAAAGGALVLADRPEPERLQIVTVTSSLFRILRVQPARGQLFTPANEIAGNHRLLVISDGLWRRRFGGDPQIIGRSLPTADGSWTIVAVMPPGFVYPVGLPTAIEAWAPLVSTAALHDRDVPGRAYYLRVTGRLSEGTTIERARAQMNEVNAQLARDTPRGSRTRRFASSR